jgi:hypothetical protein
MENWQAQGQDAGSRLETELPDPLGGPFEPIEVPARLRNAGIDLEVLKGHYALVGLLPGGADARGLAVHLNSAQFQYASKGLAIVAALQGSTEQRSNTAMDRALRGIQVVPLTETAVSIAALRNKIPFPRRPRPLFAENESAATYLIQPDGRLLRSWDAYRPAKEIVAALRAVLGPPSGVAETAGPKVR